MAGFDNDVMYADNVDFSGGSPVSAKVTLDGQLLIGSTASPNIRVNTLTAGSGISITNGAGSITITNTGGGGGGGGASTLAGDSGSATEVGGVINVVGDPGITTTGDGVQTLTISPANDLAAVEALSGSGYATRTGSETWALRTFQAGSGITLTNADGVSGNTTITASAIVPTTFTEDAGSATPAANNLNVLGTSAQGISTSGAGSTVTITAANASAVQKGVASFNVTNFTATAGNITSNALTVTAGTGLTTGGSVNLGGAVTLNLDVPVSVANGGTGRITLTDNGVLYGDVTSPVGMTAAGTNGQVLIAATGAAPAFGTVGGTQGVTLTTGANSLSIGLVNVPNSALQNSSITVNEGPGIDVSGSPVSLGGAITISASGENPTQFTADSGSAIPVSNNLNIFGTSAQGISTSASGATVTVTAANATTVSKGVASFNGAQFSVSSGAVSLLNSPVTTLTPNEDFDGSAATPVAPQTGTISILGSNPSFATVSETYNTTGASTGNLAVEHRAWLTGLVVDASTTPGTRGTYSTIASALTAAVSGQDIFIRPGTYTENLTLKAGVNLTAFGCDAYGQQVTISGKASASFAGTAVISGINLQTNSDFALAVTGSSDTNIFLFNCSLTGLNNTIISYTSSNSGSKIVIRSSIADLQTTGIALYSSSGAGQLTFENCALNNTGDSTTLPTFSDGTLKLNRCISGCPIRTTGGNLNACVNSQIDTASINTTALTATTGGTLHCYNSSFAAGTASAINAGASTTINLLNAVVTSSNANVVTGSGEVKYTPLSFGGASVAINPTTQTTRAFGPRILLSGGCEILSGSGSPSGSVTAPKGSLWLRTDGTTTNNRAYINTNGGTTWTALTTVA